MSSKDPLSEIKVRAATPPGGEASVVPVADLNLATPPFIPEPAAGKRSKAVAEEPLPPPPRPAPPLDLFEVITQCTVSWGGQTLTLKPGKRFSDASHGPRTEQRLIEAGIKYRKVVE